MHSTVTEYLSQLSSLTFQTLYLVGGSVRDLLLHKQDVRDIDVIIQSGSEAIARVFADKTGGNFFFLDEKRKITRVVKHSDIGVVQFDFADFAGHDLAADLGRRDFTINAMALELKEFLKNQTAKNVIDLFQGREDIRERLVRVIKPEVLDDDPLRLLRAVRFAATLNFTLEQDTAECIRERAERISESSPERVRDELFLILSELNVEEHLHRIHSLGLLMSMFPELVPLRGFTPGMYNGHDVLTHSLKTVGYLDAVLNNLESISPEYAKTVFNHLEEPLENFISRKAALRFACLLHDIAKPETFSDREGRIRFHDHDNLGAIKASQVCQRLRLSRDSEKLITGVIKYHMRLFNLSTSGGPSKNALYRYCRDMGAALPESLLLAQADARATSEVMPKEKFSDTEKTMKTVLEYYYSKFLKVEMRPLITGQDLINLGLTPGPRFREILDDIKEQQAEGILQAKRNAIEYIKKRL